MPMSLIATASPPFTALSRSGPGGLSPTSQHRHSSHSHSQSQTRQQKQKQQQQQTQRWAALGHRAARRRRLRCCENPGGKIVARLFSTRSSLLLSLFNIWRRKKREVKRLRERERQRSSGVAFSVSRPFQIRVPPARKPCSSSAERGEWAALRDASFESSCRMWS